MLYSQPIFNFKDKLVRIYLIVKIIHILYQNFKNTKLTIL